MSISTLRKQAHAMMKGNWGVAILCYLFYLTSLSLLSYTKIGLLVSGLFTFGFSAVFTLIARGNPVNIKTFFLGFRKATIPSFVAGILVPLFIGLWGLLLVVPGIVKFYSYSMTFEILNDSPDMTAKEAMKESRKLMDGHKLDLFLLDLSFIGWILLSIITFGILTLYVVPYMQAAHEAFYESIKCTGNDDENLVAELVDEKAN